ncbi:MAG TPA: 6,7-dimethyl-8-ribityllumazine synthase [Polyangiaceae bacterium]
MAPRRPKAKVAARRVRAAGATARRGPRLAFVVARFHEGISGAMLEAAGDEARRQRAEVLETIELPGCYETPLIVDALLRKGDVDAVVVLGFIERGETLHGEVMGHVVHRALVEASLRAEKPVGLGIIGPGATEVQAELRKDGSARAAVRAVVRSLEALSKLGAR